MNNKYTSAFPQEFEGGDNKGLLKREYFAGLAMQALLSRHSDSEYVAMRAVHIADALLEALDED